jgi:hypothetical protein
MCGLFAFLELEEAARIDGASLMQVLVKIVIPLARIGILTVALLGFMASGVSTALLDHHRDAEQVPRRWAWCAR